MPIEKALLHALPDFLMQMLDLDAYVHSETLRLFSGRRLLQVKHIY